MKRSTQILLMVFLLQLALTCTVAANKESLLLQCTQAKNRGEYSQAISFCTQALEVDSNYIDALYWRGYSQTALGNYSAAVADLSKLLELQPTDAQAWSTRAAAHRRMGNLTAALSDANKSIELDAKRWDGYMTRAMIFAEMKRTVSSFNPLGA